MYGNGLDRGRFWFLRFFLNISELIDPGALVCSCSAFEICNVPDFDLSIQEVPGEPAKSFGNWFPHFCSH